jgi:hypothetical protein
MTERSRRRVVPFGALPSVVEVDERLDAARHR